MNAKVPSSKAYCSRGITLCSDFVVWILICRKPHFLHYSDALCQLCSNPANALLQGSKLHIHVCFTQFPSPSAKNYRKESRSLESVQHERSHGVQILNGVTWRQYSPVSSQWWEICSCWVSSFAVWKYAEVQNTWLHKQREVTCEEMYMYQIGHLLFARKWKQR